MLTDAAEKLYALHDNEQAAGVAQRVLDAEAAGRRRAAPRRLDRARPHGVRGRPFDRAEKAYGEVLKLAPANDPARGELVERQAASIYKQGEQARAAGENREAAATFARVGDRRARLRACARTRSTTPPPR